MDIDKTALVEGDNKLGESAKIGPFCNVKNIKIGRGTVLTKYVNAYGCEIGENCKICTFVEIQEGAKIGNNVTISSHAFICDLVTIEDGVWIGHGVKTINDIYPPSKKRTGNDKNWKPTNIGKNSIIGSNTVLFPINIGENAVIGAGSVVRNDIPAGQVWAGNPAKYICDTKDLKYDKNDPESWVFLDLRE